MAWTHVDRHHRRQERVKSFVKRRVSLTERSERLADPLIEKFIRCGPDQRTAKFAFPERKYSFISYTLLQWYVSYDVKSVTYLKNMRPQLSEALEALYMGIAITSNFGKPRELLK